jgi:hypothetical protein
MPEPSPQNLLEEVSKWKHNRAVYPGWLIAPETVRDTLWQHTQVRVFSFMQARSILSLHQELDVLSELNWRLETSLTPLWNELIPAYEHVLGAINPFPQEITDLPAATLVLCDANAGEANWSVIRQQWLSVAFGALRFYREERQADAFDTLHARLDRLGDVIGDVRARWCYERCLFAFGEMDDESVIQALNQWPSDSHDVFWLVRKAMVLAEIGRTQQALELNNVALAKLREGLSDAVDHIPGLSREGWALRLGHALRSNQRWSGIPGDEMADREEVRRRFNQLKKYGCNPDEICDYFESRLEQPSPQITPEVETVPGFEPGTISRTVQMGNDVFAKLSPAYQYSRLVEEAAHPPAFGHVIVCKEKLVRVAEWLAEHDPVRTQSLMLRLRDKKLVERYASRHRIAALRPEVVLRLKSIARRGIDQSLPEVSASFRPGSDGEIRAASRLECAMELMSRVCIREPESGLGDLWDLACKLYREPAIRAGLSFEGPLRNLFSNLIEATPNEQLIQQIPAVFRLPVGQEAGFLVSLPDRWPDPATMVTQRFDSSQWQRPPSWAGEVKRRLFSLSRNADPRAKRTAFLRLLRMSELGMLSESDCRQLSRIFWGPAAATLTLPMEAWQFWTPWFALRLPRLPKPAPRIDACEIVRQHILSFQLGEVHGGQVRPESCFDLILDATEMKHRTNQSPHRWYVPWTRADIQSLFLILRTWWQNHGRSKAEELRQVTWRGIHDGGTFRTYMNRFWDVLRMVIIPRMTRRAPAINAVVDLIADVSSAGLPVGAVLPATLLLQPNTVNQVVSRLRQEFANPAIEFYLSALRGIVYWVDQSRDNGRSRRMVLPRVPADLLREISMAVALRRPESIDLYLDFAFNVLHRLGEHADRQFVRNLLIGLDYLLGETAYQEVAKGATRYRYEDIPRIRLLAARLAKCVSDCGYGANPTIMRWAEAIAVDPLPEVRRIVAEGGIV